MNTRSVWADKVLDTPHEHDRMTVDMLWFKSKIHDDIIFYNERQDEAEVCMAQQMLELVNSCLIRTSEGKVKALTANARIVSEFMFDALGRRHWQLMSNSLSISSNAIEVMRQLENKGLVREKEDQWVA